MQPIARVGMPQDIADAALLLGSEQASFVTGQSIVVDGGLVVCGWGLAPSPTLRRRAGHCPLGAQAGRAS